MKERRCECRLRTCKYCVGRERYELHYEDINAKMKAVGKLKKLRRQEVLSMPPDVLIHEVLEEDEV